LYFGTGLPRSWVASGKEISIRQAPTRWGRVNFKMQSDAANKVVVATVELPAPRAPKEVQVKFRVSKTSRTTAVTVNGRPASFGGLHGDTVTIPSGSQKAFEVVARLE